LVYAKRVVVNNSLNANQAVGLEKGRFGGLFYWMKKIERL